jgi:hypothetical protein
VTEDGSALTAVGAPPRTGNHEIDRALASLELGEDVATHHDAVVGVLDAIQRAMNGPVVPSGLRPVPNESPQMSRPK